MDPASGPGSIVKFRAAKLEGHSEFLLRELRVRVRVSDMGLFT